MQIMQLVHFYASTANKEGLLTEIDIKKVDVNLRDINSGATPLHYAADEGDVEIVRLLIERGANIYAQDAFLNTPLFRAVSYAMRVKDEKKLPDYYEVFRILLRHEAKLHHQQPDKYKSYLKDIENDSQYTPFSWLKRKGKTHILQELEKIISEIEQEQRELEKQRRAAAQTIQPIPVSITSKTPDNKGLTHRHTISAASEPIRTSASDNSEAPAKELSSRSLWDSIAAFFYPSQKAEEQQHLIPQSHTPPSPNTKRTKVNYKIN